MSELRHHTAICACGDHCGPGEKEFLCVDCAMADRKGEVADERERIAAGLERLAEQGARATDAGAAAKAYALREAAILVRQDNLP